MYSDSRLLMGSTILDDSKVQRLVSNLEDKEKVITYICQSPTRLHLAISLCNSHVSNKR